MNGYQVSFFFEQDRRHDGAAMHEWLLRTARSLGIEGGTLLPASEGYGRAGRLHSAHFVELGDQPVEFTMAMTTERATALFELLERERVDLFYVKTAIEFGRVGG
ncbi:MAG: DUF190 domain-containing protein [Proteobacteria bacterium]|nr:DUF190 domain-containing protein [Pseudomonadota bacterium]